MNREIFGSLWEARVVIEQWRLHHNEARPHSSLGYQTPSEYGGRGLVEAQRLMAQSATPNALSRLNLPPARAILSALKPKKSAFDQQGAGL